MAFKPVPNTYQELIYNVLSRYSKSPIEQEYIDEMFRYNEKHNQEERLKHALRVAKRHNEPEYATLEKFAKKAHPYLLDMMKEEEKTWKEQDEEDEEDEEEQEEENG